MRCSLCPSKTVEVPCATCLNLITACRMRRTRLDGLRCRCENCPAINTHQTKNGFAIIENPSFDLHVRTRTTEISWNGGSFCLVICHDITDSRQTP